MLRFQRPCRHDRRNRTAEAQHHGKKRPAGHPHLSHNPVHNIGHPGHVTAVLQNGKRQKQDEYVGDKGQDTSHTGNYPIHHKGNHPSGHVKPFQTCPHQIRKNGKRVFQSALQKIPHKKCQEKY